MMTDFDKNHNKSHAWQNNHQQEFPRDKMGLGNSFVYPTGQNHKLGDNKKRKPLFRNQGLHDKQIPSRLLQAGSYKQNNKVGSKNRSYENKISQKEQQHIEELINLMSQNSNQNDKSKIDKRFKEMKRMGLFKSSDSQQLAQQIADLQRAQAIGHSDGIIHSMLSQIFQAKIYISITY